MYSINLFLSLQYQLDLRNLEHASILSELYLYTIYTILNPWFQTWHFIVIQQKAILESVQIVRAIIILCLIDS